MDLLLLPCGDGGSPVLNGQHSKHFSVEAWSKPRCERTLVAVLTKPNRGGSNVLYRNDDGRAMAYCHGHLQSAGNASWPLYCPARYVWRALLSCTRGTSSSSAPLTRSGHELQSTLLPWHRSRGLGLFCFNFGSLQGASTSVGVLFIWQMSLRTKDCSVDWLSGQAAFGLNPAWAKVVGKPRWHLSGLLRVACKKPGRGGR